MNQNFKLIVVVIAALVIYHYFVAAPAKEFLSDILDDEEPDMGVGGTKGSSVMAQTGNGTTVAALSGNVYGSGQDNQRTVADMQRTVVLR